VTRRQLLKAGAAIPAAVASLQLLGAEASAAAGGAGPSNVVQLENSLQGTTAWQLTNPDWNGVICGYASDVSINRGQPITFYFSASQDTVGTFAIYRLGWYGGKGGRLITGPFTINLSNQKTPAPNPTTGLNDMGWKASFVDNSQTSANSATIWPSGVYVAVITGHTTGLQEYVTFVVRDDARASDILFQQSVLTYQAYNFWGGISLYPNANNVEGLEVSFNRPYDRSWGAGDLLCWDIQLIRFLERYGYDVTYATDIDMARGRCIEAPHKAIVLGGHDEYWTYGMRLNMETCISNGINLAVFGADACYWQVRLQPDANGNPDRTIVAYKTSAANDPYYLTGQSLTTPQAAYYNNRVTGLWRAAPLNAPEAALLGGMFHLYPASGNVIVDNASHWFWANTGAVNGTAIPGILGYETDAVAPSSPANTVLLTNSPDAAGYANSTIYTAPSGAQVFNAGTMFWSFGLDSYPSWWTYSNPQNLVSPVAQQATLNLLNNFTYQKPIIASNLLDTPAPASHLLAQGDAPKCPRDRRMNPYG